MVHRSGIYPSCHVIDDHAIPIALFLYVCKFVCCTCTVSRQYQGLRFNLFCLADMAQEPIDILTPDRQQNLTHLCFRNRTLPAMWQTGTWDMQRGAYWLIMLFLLQIAPRRTIPPGVRAGGQNSRSSTATEDWVLLQPSEIRCAEDDRIVTYPYVDSIRVTSFRNYSAERLTEEYRIPSCLNKLSGLSL